MLLLCHAELYLLAYLGFKLGKVVCIHRCGCNCCTDSTSYVTANVVRVYTIPEWRCKAYHNVLAGMHIGHYSYLAALEHTMIDKTVYDAARITLQCI